MKLQEGQNRLAQRTRRQRQRTMQQHRIKKMLAGVLALAWWSTTLLGRSHANYPGTESEEPQRERRRSLRALAEYFDPGSRVPYYDDKSVVIYLVETHAGDAERPHQNYRHSTFMTGILQRYGSGRLDYHVKNSVTCDRSCSRKFTESSPCVVVTTENDCPAKYRQCNFPQCKTMIVGDEGCNTRTHHDIRTYYSGDKSTRDKAYLPLGPRWDAWTAFKMIRLRPGFVMKPSSRRNYAFNAIFSQDTNAGREQLAGIIDDHRDESDLPTFTTVAKKWASMISGPHSTHLNSYRYVDTVFESVFTLSPAGHNPECYRLFEAVEAGSIPILVQKDLTSGYTNGCKDSLHYWRDAPILKLDSWEDLFPTVERLMEDKGSLDKMQTDLLVWYENFMHKVVVDFEDFMQASYDRNQVPSIAAAGNTSEIDPCDDIVVFVPDTHLNLGKQLNYYLLAVMMATFMNKPMAILDAPQDLICPGEYSDQPLGFSSVVKHPDWLIRECAVPCQSTHEYSDWDTFRHTLADDSPLTSCVNDNGKSTNVLVLGGDETLGIFEKYFKDAMVYRSASIAYDWALRAGAKPEEAETFSKLDGNTMWDYLSTILIRSEVIRFQTSILKDSIQHIKTGIYPQGPYHTSFDALHIRRGDDVLTDPEAKSYVDNYWDARGLFNRVTQTAKYNFIPLHQYLRHFYTMECSTQVRKAYIATDDPTGVEREIAELGTKSHGATRLNDCHTIKFTISRIKSNLGTSDDCAAQYANTIGSIADFITMSNADTFVGDSLSDWGKLIRMFRLELNPETGTSSDQGSLRPLTRLMRTQVLTQTLEIQGRPNPVLLRDTRLAWGRWDPSSPI